MRRILRRHDWSRGSGDVLSGEVVGDEWRLFGEEIADTDAVIVPLAELRKDTAAWLARPGRLGVRLAPSESVESLADVLPRIALVAVEFPGVGEGRGFSYGRLLRDRLNFKGELRAVGGAVKQDKIFLLARCGFDSFELPPEEKADEALAALHRYDVVYQPAEPIEGIRQQRYFA
jgi:phosphoadenosine phosphosulfate reductase